MYFLIRSTSLAILLTVIYPSYAMAQTTAERIAELEAELDRQMAVIAQQQEALKSLREQLTSIRSETASAPSTIDKALVSPTPLELDEKVTTPVSSPQKSDFEMDIYGFVMADAIYDFKRVDPDWNDTLRVSTIPTTPGLYGEDGEFVFSVRQSRLGITSEWETGVGKVSALLEMELFGVGGDAGQTTPRLRHAWGTWKNFGMGQYWSNFMDADVFPNTIDYWGPTGMVFYRNMQARYTWFNDDHEFALSMEEPGTAITVGKFRDECSSNSNCDSTLNDVIQAKNDIPDFVARYRSNTSWGHWQLAGIARKLGFERRDTWKTDHEYGWGLNASTVVNMADRDQLKLQLVYGEGIGNYLNDGGVDIAPRSASLNDNGARAVPLLGLVAYYDHYWNERWSTSLGWSTTRLDTTAGQLDSEFDNGQIAQINLLHYPTDGVLLGGELIWGERVDIDGTDAEDLRLQMSLKVHFP